MKVLKFGGTSVGSADRIKFLTQIINPAKRSILVFSAMSGITNRLIEISSELEKKNIKSASKKWAGIINHFKQTAKELLDKETYKDNYSAFLEEKQMEWDEKSQQPSFLCIPWLIGQGEVLTVQLIYEYFQNVGLECAQLNAYHFMRKDRENEPDYFYIREKLLPLIKNTGNKIIITQGFICLNYEGLPDHFSRGGSDFSAAIIAHVVDALELEIWTDISGIHNNDPRFVKKTKPIKHLSFHEASEMAYFGAKVLHPSTLLPCIEKKIPVILKNSFDPAAPGTLITDESGTKGIKAVASKDGITVIKIRSGRMLQAYGFLRKIFEIFEWYKTSVDVITTSEVAVSMTIDNDTYLSEIVNDLKKLGDVQVDTGQCLISIIGNFEGDTKGYAKKIFASLEEVPIRMISYGGSNYNITLVVDIKYKSKALQCLNDHLEFVQ